MATTWTISVDWDKNGNYTGTYDNVTSRVVSANWFLGMREPYQEVADNSLLTLTLRNHDRLYSPDNSGSALAGKLLPFRPVKIESNDGTARTHWTGWIESIKPEVDQRGQRTVQIMASGIMQLYRSAEVKIALQENKRSDEVIATLLAEVPQSPQFDTDTGDLTIVWAGDNWVKQGGYADSDMDTFDVYRAIADTTAAEHGRFFFARNGNVQFWSRSHFLTAQPLPDANRTFSDSMQQMTYTYVGIDQCKNEVTVVSHPRTVGTTNELLWSLPTGEYIEIHHGQTRKLYVKYRDHGTNNRIGGKDVALHNVTHSQGNSTSSVNPKANGAELVFTSNSNTSAPTIVNGAEVKGKKITSFDQVESVAKDQASIDAYGRRPLKLNLPVLSSSTDAQNIANYELGRHKEPRGMVTTLTVGSHGTEGGGYHARQLALTLRDRIRVVETQSGHDGDYTIIGEAHTLGRGGAYYETMWYLEPTVYALELDNANTPLSINSVIGW